MAMRLLLSLCVLAAGVVTGPVSLEAQTVLSRVVDAETGEPVAGALAYLIDREGETVRNVLTDQIGRAMFVNVPEGSYRIRIEMIGRQTTESEGFAVEGASTAQVEVRLPSSAIMLEGIAVSADERCRIRPEDGVTLSRVWDEARKALEAASYTDRSDVYRYSTEMYERDLDRNARLVLEEVRSTRAGFMRIPFESRPAEDLVEQGFVQTGPDGARNYFAPDARVLLSDVFLDSHCLRLAEGEDEAEGLIGVAFEPTADRSRRVPDISGTLWLDPETAELRWLSYRYVNVLPEIATDLIGGRVEFRRMPDGTWIVPEWWIRMPRLVEEHTVTGDIRRRIGGYRQSGGRVLEVRDRGGDAFMRGESGTIEGFVQDSLGIVPLSGVRVGVVGSNQLVFTDEEGRFEITGLTDGTYEIRFVDTRLEEYG
ncbi:MAG: carboxypeptidase regulatory-like domain-containing protein, partial [Gemmatimonadota bacterium]